MRLTEVSELNAIATVIEMKDQHQDKIQDENRVKRRKIKKPKGQIKLLKKEMEQKECKGKESGNKSSDKASLLYYIFNFGKAVF